MLKIIRNDVMINDIYRFKYDLNSNRVNYIYYSDFTFQNFSF